MLSMKYSQLLNNLLCIRRRPIRSKETRVSLAIETLEDRTVPVAGLVAAYNFDQGSGSVLTDLSGSGNDGVISNATWSNTGKTGNSLRFNGANSLVTVADNASLDLTTGMTLEAWVRP